jgi:hypothetical protein
MKLFDHGVHAIGGQDAERCRLRTGAAWRQYERDSCDQGQKAHISPTWLFGFLECERPR